MPHHGQNKKIAIKYDKYNHLVALRCAASNRPFASVEDEYSDNYDDELDQYLKLKPASLAQCLNPIHWWLDQKANCPNLCWMAVDYLIVPGMFMYCLK